MIEGCVQDTEQTLNAELLGPTGGTRDVSPKISRASEAGDLRKEVGGGTAMGGRPDLQQGIQDAEKPEAGQHGGREHKEACLTVLLDEDRALPHRVVPALDKESAYCLVPVVPIPVADPGSLIQGAPQVEASAEDPVGGGVGGDWEDEEPVEDPRPPCRQEVQPDRIGLPLYYRCGKASAEWGRRGGARRRNGSSASAGGGERRGGQRRRS